MHMHMAHLHAQAQAQAPSLYYADTMHIIPGQAAPHHLCVMPIPGGASSRVGDDARRLHARGIPRHLTLPLPLLLLLPLPLPLPLRLRLPLPLPLALTLTLTRIPRPLQPPMVRRDRLAGLCRQQYGSK